MSIGDKSDITLASFLGRAPDQVGYVVHDFDGAVQEFGRRMGIRRWKGWVYDAAYCPQRWFRGKDEAWSSKVAIPEYGPQLEIIVGLEGESVFSEFLDARGPGLHHIGYFVPSLDEAIASLEAQGFEVVQRGGGHGVEGDGQFCFFDFTDVVGSYLELIEPPAKRYGPQFEIDTL